MSCTNIIKPDEVWKKFHFQLIELLFNFPYHPSLRKIIEKDQDHVLMTEAVKEGEKRETSVLTEKENTTAWLESIVLESDKVSQALAISSCWILEIETELSDQDYKTAYPQLPYFNFLAFFFLLTLSKTWAHIKRKIQLVWYERSMIKLTVKSFLPLSSPPKGN